MANRRSSIKKIRVDIRRRENNVRVISELKTELRKTNRAPIRSQRAQSRDDDDGRGSNRQRRHRIKRIQRNEIPFLTLRIGVNDPVENKF